MQGELALVREELALVQEELRPLRQQRLWEAAKQEPNNTLLEALRDEIRPLAVTELGLLEVEHAKRLKAQATGEQSFSQPF